MHFSIVFMFSSNNDSSPAGNKLLCFLLTCTSLCYTTWAQYQNTHLKQTLPYYFLSLRSRGTLIALYSNMLNKCSSLKETVFSTRCRGRIWCPPTIRIQGVLSSREKRPQLEAYHVRIVARLTTSGTIHPLPHTAYSTQ